MSSMTKQEAIEILTEMRDWNDYITQSDALQMAIDALEKEPAANSEDAISRQAVMDGLEKYHDGADLHIDGLTYAYDLVCKLPSVSVAINGHCEDCDYFKPKFDEFTTVWGPVRQCSRYECTRLNAKTEKNGYCHMFEKRNGVEE